MRDAGRFRNDGGGSGGSPVGANDIEVGTTDNAVAGRDRRPRRRWPFVPQAPADDVEVGTSNHAVAVEVAGKTGAGAAGRFEELDFAQEGTSSSAPVSS